MAGPMVQGPGGQMLQPQIILLREGTDTSQGKGQVISNINACTAIVDIVRTTLGPRGMDKLIHKDGKVTISNDGATIMKLLDIAHPAAKTLVDIARSQDAEVGDGTTSVVVLAGEFMKEAKPFIEDSLHSQTVIRAFRQAFELADEKIKELRVGIADAKDPAERRSMLEKCASTSMQSKLVSQQKEFFSKMVVDAVLHLEENLDLNMIGIKKVPGGSLTDSQLVEGVAFKRTFSYAGFEQQPKHITNPVVALLNVELELKSEKENAEIRLKDPSQYQEIVDAEWQIIYDKLDCLVKCGANVVLSKLPIGDLATQYFADRGIFCAGRVADEDLKRVAKATGGAVQTSVNNIIPEVLGHCGLMEEKQVGNERYNFFTGMKDSKTVTLVLRGGAEQFIEETERSLHDAIMIVRRAVKNPHVVGGGGAIEMELSKFLREHARTIEGKAQLIINAYARALEIVPRQLCDNAGFDSTDILNKLRAAHAKGGKWMGVDIVNNGVTDTFESFVWEPSLVKRNALSAATEAACTILSVDETVRNPQSEMPDPNMAQRGPGARGRGRGRGGLPMGGRGVRALKGMGGK